MNREDIIRMATKAGWQMPVEWDDTDGFSRRLERFAALAAEQPVAKAWAEGYQQGVKDERTSEASIGIAGFGAKVEPARQNPYGTALAAEPQKHPGYIIGSHWLETAYSRICAGEAEADVLRDCGWERVDEALRRDAERYRWLRDKAPPDIGDMASVRDSHDPSEIDAAIDAAMKEGT